MSKFIDRIKRVSQTAYQPMGFRLAEPTQDEPKLLLVASLAQTDIGGLADYAAGADAGLLSIPELPSGVKTLQAVSQAIPDVPWGCRLGNVSQKEIKQVENAGCDFVVFPAARTSLAIPQDDELGKILEVEMSLSEGLLRTVNELPVDALLITKEPGKDYFLTWHHLMLLRRFAELLTKPLLVSVPAKVTANELLVLWEAGMDGVIVEVEMGQPKQRLKKLRRATDKLTFSSRHKQGKAGALLPHIAEKRVIPAEEEE